MLGAQFVQFTLGQIEDLPTVKGGGSSDAAVGRQQPHQSEGGLRFTGARFAHNAERLARLQGEVQVIDGGDIAIRRFKGDAEIFHVQQQAAVTLRLRRLCRFNPWSWQRSLAVFRVEGITQTIADKVETEQGHHQETRREQQQPGRDFH